MGEDQWAPNIGDDGEGFEAISHNIRYPEIPDTLKLSHFADSLLQCYNIALAFSTMAYDVSTAERYISEPDFRLAQADALDSLNISGIGEREIREALLAASKTAAAWIRKGVEPNSKESPAVDKFYEAYNKYSTAFIENHISDEEFKPETILEDYSEIHAKALADTASFRRELLRMTLEEIDFSNSVFWPVSLLIATIAIRKEVTRKWSLYLISYSGQTSIHLYWESCGECGE